MTSKLPQIKTRRTVMEILGPQDAELMLAFYRDNREHLRAWEPERNDLFFTRAYWQELLSENQSLCLSGAAFKFAALSQDRSELIGTCNFSNIVHGVFQACHLGYSIAGKYEGQGLMHEILEAGIDYMFTEHGLHRIMANHLPENTRSANLLERLGFEREGIAHSYLFIAGQWRDHVMTALINDEA